MLIGHSNTLTTLEASWSLIIITIQLLLVRIQNTLGANGRKELKQHISSAVHK